MKLMFISELHLENHSAFYYKILHMHWLLTEQVSFVNLDVFSQIYIFYVSMTVRLTKSRI